METRNRIVSIALVVVMILAMMPFSAFSLEVSDKVSEVELTLPEAKAGETVNLDFSAVEVKHHMTYKVVGIRWYKYLDDRQMGVESGADTYFIGGQSYTVEIDLEVKSGNSGWNLEYEGYETDYSGIHATVNGKDATVKRPPWAKKYSSAALLRPNTTGSLRFSLSETPGPVMLERKRVSSKSVASKTPSNLPMGCLLFTGGCPPR